MLSAGLRSSLALSLSCFALAGCAFDSGGNGFPDGASIGNDDTSGTEGGDDADGEASTADAPMTTTRGDTPGGQATTDDPTSAGSDDGRDDEAGDSEDGEADSNSTDAEDDDSTGAPDVDECPASVFDVYWVEQADVDPPMTLIAADANDNPKVASSAVAESGEVTLSIDFACPGEFTLWGLVWDYEPGPWAAPDPDSFYFDVGGDQSTWRYGCQTTDEASGLSWQRMAALSAQPCDASYIVLEVYEAGTVELTLRNREEGDGSRVAGIAAIAVSSDPDAHPAALYDPY